MAEPGLIFNETHRVGSWVADQMPDGADFHNYYAMGAEKEGELVSGIVFESYNGHNANVHIAVSKPNKLFLKLLDHAFIYAFETCGLKRVTGLVDADHVRSIQLNLHVGFRIEAVMQQAGSSGQDLLVLVLWPENYYRGKKSWEKAHRRHQTTRH